MSLKTVLLHTICRHAAYRLTCADYDCLVMDHDDRCAICGIAGPETARGFLVTDHDHTAGDWAVRGLLCTRCNNTLDAYRHTRTPAENAYLADPWWPRHFAWLGLPVEPMAEPPVGATVAVEPFQWTRTRDGWERPRASHGPLTWETLNRHQGPHKIRLVDPAAAATGKTPVRNLRVVNEVWQPALDAAREQGRTLTDVITDFLRWYLRMPGAKLPERPPKAPAASEASQPKD